MGGILRVRHPQTRNVACSAIKVFGAFYGRDDSPRCPFRSKPKVNWLLHALHVACNAHAVVLNCAAIIDVVYYECR